MDESAFKKQVDEIGRRIGPLELEQLCFVSDVDSSEVEHGVGLVNKLWNQERISYKNISFLKNLLESVGLDEVLKDFFDGESLKAERASLEKGDCSDRIAKITIEEPALTAAGTTNELSLDAKTVLSQCYAGDSTVDHDKILEHLAMDFTPYKYQRSLATPSIKGLNSIIALKTGGGKTHTAAYIAKYHYVRSLAMEKIFKGVFVVPIRVLVEQQRKVLQQAFPHDRNGPSKVGKCSETGQFLEMFKKSDVVVCTAQVLINSLRKKDIAIKDISLLIMDECHHTDKKHPYSVIMNYYRKAKYDGNISQGSECYSPNDLGLPQILGLSASLGAGSKSKNKEEARQNATDKLQKMCQNMDSPTVVFPEADDVQSLEENVPELGDDIPLFVDRRVNGTFRKKLVRIAESIAASSGALDLDGLREPDINYQKIIQALVLIEQGAAGDDKELQIAAVYAYLFVRAMEHLEITRAADVTAFLQYELEAKPGGRYVLVTMDEEFDSTVKNKICEIWSDSQNELEEISKRETIGEVPILHELKSLLLEKFAEPDAKGIVLSRSRFSTEALENFISTSPKLKQIVRPGRLVGHAEMTDEQDRAIISQFRDGTKNLLVATDIAQEGLDIPNCNFVIRYSFVSNEIGDVQAKGRARMPNAKRYSLIVRGSLEEKLEEKNRVLVEAMKNALKIYSAKDKNKWKDDVEKEQEKEFRMEQVKEAQIRRGKEDPAHYVLVCKACSEELVPAKDVLKWNHHYIVDNWEEYRERMRTVDIPPGDQLSFPTESYISHVYCVKCGSCVGKIIFVKVLGNLHGDQTILSKDGIRYKCTGPLGEINTKKFQWTKVPFWIKEYDFDKKAIDEEGEEEDDLLDHFKDFD